MIQGTYYTNEGGITMANQAIIAKKEEVQVLAQNETQSAISAGFDSYANVITTASKAVEKGDYVRLAQQ